MRDTFCMVLSGIIICWSFYFLFREDDRRRERARAARTLAKSEDPPGTQGSPQNANSGH